MAQQSKWVKPCSHGEPLQYRFVAFIEKSLSTKALMENLSRFLMCQWHISAKILTEKHCKCGILHVAIQTILTKDVYQV